MVILLVKVLVHNGIEYKELPLEDVGDYYRFTSGGEGLFLHNISILTNFVNKDFKHNNHPVKFMFYQYNIATTPSERKFTSYTATSTGFSLTSAYGVTSTYNNVVKHQISSFTINVNPIANDIDVELNKC